METVTSPNGADNKTAKKTRHRSVAYPSYTIEQCVAFTTRIDDEFTSINYTPAKDISETLEVSGGAFLMQLSSCSQYGLLDQKYGEGYKPSTHFEKIKKPLPEENVNDALIECFQNPPLYKKLINDFREKQLPSEKGLANILDRNYQIKGNAANLAAKVFLRNANALGLIASGNIFKLDSYIPFEVTTDEEKEDVSEQPKLNDTAQQLMLPQTQEPPKPLEHKGKQKETKEIPVFLKGDNREAKVVLPIDFTEDDLNRVIKVLNAYL